MMSAIFADRRRSSSGQHDSGHPGWRRTGQKHFLASRHFSNNWNVRRVQGNNNGESSRRDRHQQHDGRQSNVILGWRYIQRCRRQSANGGRPHFYQYLQNDHQFRNRRSRTSPYFLLTLQASPSLSPQTGTRSPRIPRSPALGRSPTTPQQQTYPNASTGRSSPHLKDIPNRKGNK